MEELKVGLDEGNSRMKKGFGGEGKFVCLEVMSINGIPTTRACNFRKRTEADSAEVPNSDGVCQIRKSQLLLAACNKFY